MGKLYAISDLHISHKFNLDAFDKFFAEPSPQTSPASRLYSKGDGLILAGDVTETVANLRHCFQVVTQIFGTVWWVPGNHELYTLPARQDADIPDDGSDEYVDKHLRGEAKYDALVEVARAHGVLTPEDEYVPFTVGSKEQHDPMNDHLAMGPEALMATATYTDDSDDDAAAAAETSYLICPIFTLYDYSFRPSHVTRADALSWAMEQSIQATDEHLLHPNPHATRDAWCETLVAKFTDKLAAAVAAFPTRRLVIINHWPLREDLVHIPLVPRFSLWCGTKMTQDWHTRFNAAVVVSGHLHVRRTDWKDGVRFEEVSLGYPRQWEGVRQAGKGIGDLVREMLPAVEGGRDPGRGTVWRTRG